MLTSLHRARYHVAVAAARAATFASQKTGRGAGGMIGGLIAGFIDPSLMENLAGGRPVTIITGTNGKSTTTRMVAAAERTRFSVCTNSGGDNMDAGIISALLGGRDASHVVLEVDELHVPNAAAKLDADQLVLLNLSRDQLDRVGEINMIERRLREAVESRPTMRIIANCDDVMVTSVAFDHPNVVWVAAGAGWTGDSTSCPRTESHIVRDGDDWFATKPLADGREFRRPTPDYSVEPEGSTPHGLTPQGDSGSAGYRLVRHSDGHSWPLALKLPGRANVGNAAQAIVAAVGAGVVPDDAVAAVSEVDSVAGRYSTVEYRGRQVHLLLAKNPAGWQEALSMVDRSADAVVIAVNGQVADGEDLSWLWDVRFEDFDDIPVVAAGERGTDLAVRLGYASIDHTLIHDTVQAIESCPKGRVEVLANYTAFRDLKKALARAEEK